MTQRLQLREKLLTGFSPQTCTVPNKQSKRSNTMMCDDIRMCDDIMMCDYIPYHFSHFLNHIQHNTDDG